LALDGDILITVTAITDGATLTTDGDIRDGATLAGDIQAGDIHIMDTTTLITTEEEVLLDIMEIETMLITEIIALIEDIQLEEATQLTETTLLIEETIPRIGIIPQIDLTATLISEILTEEQLVQPLQIEDLTVMALIITIAPTVIEGLITIAEIPQQTEVTPLATTEAHQEVIHLAALHVQ
jgi:hypothetical protein